MAGYHQKHFFETSSYQASPGGAILSSTGQGLPPFYRGSLALDLPVPASLHMMRGRGEVKDREEAENQDRRGRELNERWVAAAQLAERQRQRGEVENQIRMFNPRSQVLPTVHEFTHDTLVSRFVLRQGPLRDPCVMMCCYRSALPQATFCFLATLVALHFTPVSDSVSELVIVSD